MRNSLSRYYKFIAAVFLSITFLSCKRDKIPEHVVVKDPLFTSAASVNGNAPAAQIAASEKLPIPVAISLPDNLPDGNTRVATYFAEGVQKYRAREKAGTDPIVYEWVFVAPQAELYDGVNARVGSHGAGPFWELSATDSIFAQHFSPAKTAPSPDAGSIDWLLLMPKTGSIPTGIFADVDYIQRIATKGGKAPETAPTNANATISVKYKAIYRFTKKTV